MLERSSEFDRLPGDGDEAAFGIGLIVLAFVLEGAFVAWCFGLI